MASSEAKDLYRARGLCELTNANARRMAMTQLLVRGVAKGSGGAARSASVALITAIAHGLLAHATTLLA